METLEKKLGMCFYKFVAYFQMPFGALIAAATGVLFLPDILNKLVFSLQNAQYGFYHVGRLYFLTDNSAKPALIFYAVALFAMAIYCVYISFSLAKFKKDAPKHIYINLILEKIVIYIFMAVLLISQKDIVDISVESIMELVPRVVTDVMSVVLWLLIYSKYFNKRKHLFVN
ncbi:MAG: hypothetical protein IJE19_00395 [Clostridia bacterium]|nr:hypothetical protein [Clostridia bacterium]